jgi:hypothetical protein
MPRIHAHRAKLASVETAKIETKPNSVGVGFHTDADRRS